MIDITNKIASKMGFDASTYMRNQTVYKELIYSCLNGAVPLHDYLQYRYFDSEKKLFYLEEDVVGFIFEIAPIVGVDEALVKNLNYFFERELPQNSVIQFLLLASSDITDILDHWSNGRIANNNLLQKITKKRSDFIRSLAAQYANNDGRLARDFRIYISFSCKIHNSRTVREILLFKKALLTKLETINLSPRECDTADLIRVIREIFEFAPGHAVNNKSSNPSAPLNEQLLNFGFKYNLEENNFTNETTKIATRCYYPKNLPVSGSLWWMIDLLGSSDRVNLNIPARFIISYCVASSEKNQDAYVAQGRRVIHAAEQVYSRHNRDLKRDAEEWQDIIDRAKNGERFLTESFCVMISSEVKHIDIAEQSLTSLYQLNDWELVSVAQFHLPAILSNLPLQQIEYWKILRKMRLVRICQSSEVVAKLPIHGEWKGVPLPGVLLLGRRGQLFQWNPFYRITSGNYNVCVIGPSGGGKSVFLQSLADSMMAQLVRVFVLDIGQSFAEMGKLFDGEIIQFGRAKALALNPFAGLRLNMNQDDFTNLIKCAKELLIIMCGVNDEYGAGTLEKAIKDAVIEYEHKLDIDLFVEYLGSINDKRLNQYAMALYSYTREGIYGKYFSGNKNATFHRQITLFEFEEIKKDKKLIAIILQVLLIEITNQFLTSDRSQKFMIIVDEAWMLLDYSAGFFAEFARTVRKYGGSLVTCVQNYSDLQKTQSHQAILENSSWTLLLKQDEKGLHSFRESEAFKDKLPLIQSVSLMPGKYSEILISATGVSVVGRLVLDEYSSALYSTDSEDFKFLKVQEARGISLDSAIEKLASKKHG